MMSHKRDEPGRGDSVLGLIMRASRGNVNNSTHDSPPRHGGVPDRERSPSRRASETLSVRPNVSGGMFEKWRTGQHTPPSSAPHRYETASPAEQQRRKHSLFYRAREKEAASGGSSPRHGETQSPSNSPRSAVEQNVHLDDTSVTRSVALESAPQGSRRSSLVDLTKEDLAGMPDAVQRHWTRRVSHATTTRAQRTATALALDTEPADAFSPSPAPKTLSLSLDESAIHPVAETPERGSVQEEGEDFQKQGEPCSACKVLAPSAHRTTLPCGHILCEGCHQAAAPCKLCDTESPAVCTECLTLPAMSKILPCGHAICLQCLPQVKAPYTCTTCSKSVEIVAGLADRSPLHAKGAPCGARKIEDFFEIATCGRCEAAPSVLSCLDCRLSFCEACSALIHTGALKEHYLEVHTTHTMPEAGRCPKANHKSRLTYFDTEKDRFLCKECISDAKSAGTTPIFIPLEDAAKKAKAELEAGFKTGGAFVEKVKGVVNVLRDHRTRVETLRREETERVNNVFGEWRRKLKEREDEILQRTAQFYQEQHDEVDHELGKQMAMLETYNRRLGKLGCILEDNAEKVARFSSAGGDIGALQATSRDLIVSRELTKLDELLSLAKVQPLRVPPLSRLHLDLAEKDWNVVVSATVDELKAEEGSMSLSADTALPRTAQWSPAQHYTSTEEVSFAKVRDDSVVANIT